MESAETEPDADTSDDTEPPLKKRPAAALPSKHFNAELEAELIAAMAKAGIEVKDYNIKKTTSKIPKWGRLQQVDDSTFNIVAAKHPTLSVAPSLGFTLYPEPVPESRKRPLPKSGLVTEPVTVPRFGTLRRHGAAHQVSTALNIRGMRDFPNVIYYSSAYKEHMAGLGEPRGKFIAPTFAEYVMGYPTHWTSTTESPAKEVGEHPAGADEKFTGASVFSGVGGLELATAKAVSAKLYCDSDAAVREVLNERIKEGVLPEGPVMDDICTLEPGLLQNIEFITAGFPCPDIAISGGRCGFAGKRSSLFGKLIIKMSQAGPKLKMALLENVGHIISTDMEDVFNLVLRWLIIVGFRDIRWGTMEACCVGSPQSRKRWYCFAQKPGADLPRLSRLLPLNADAIRSAALAPWNPKNVIPMERWLQAELSDGERERLMQLGNAVVPQAGEVVLTCLAHM